MKTLMVVVGTTEFEELVKAIDNEEIMKTLINFGFNHIIFQIGNGSYNPNIYKNFKEITAEIYKYKPTYEDDIRNADFIIGHGGAGTILDVIKNKKPLLVVINDSLMNNHQNELYDVMTKEKYIFGLNGPKDLSSNLGKILEKIEKGFLKEYPKAEKNLISKIINELY